MTRSILLVGCRSYLGHNVHSQLKGSYRFDLCPSLDENSDTFPSVNELKQAFRGRLNTQHFDWILIIPYPDVDKRSKIFLSLKDILSEAVMAKADKLPGISFVSHVGVDEMAKKDGREILAQLFDFEKFLFSTLKSSGQAIVVIRVAMLQEQLFFLLPSLFKQTWPLPAESYNINPVATQDVIDFTRKVMDPKNCSRVRGQIFTLTGDKWSRGRDRLFRFLKGKGLDDSSQPRADLFSYQNSETGRFYEIALNALIRCNRLTVSPPLWPSDTEVRLIREYLWYASWKGDPAASTSPDLEFLLDRKPRSAQSVIDTIINVLS